jgi:hypothetical protein
LIVSALFFVSTVGRTLSLPGTTHRSLLKSEVGWKWPRCVVPTSLHSPSKSWYFKYAIFKEWSVSLMFKIYLYYILNNLITNTTIYCKMYTIKQAILIYINKYYTQ